VSERRGAVLTVLQDAGGPVPVRAVADGVGVHVNTARFHLEGLVRDGLVERVEAATQGSDQTPGRPAAMYQARVTYPGTRSYQLLAQMLAQAVSGLADSSGAVTRTGLEWGRTLAAKAAAGQDPIDALLGILRSIGFDPAVRIRDEGLDLELAHCPFQEVATRDPAVVCGLHRALISGVLSALDSELRITDLQVFPQPDLCVAQLRASGAAPRQ
jgi:predicted ArsR family transcriptional regulator